MAPIPRDPPVTTATFPVNENKLSNLTLPNHLFITSANTGVMFKSELIELTDILPKHKERQYSTNRRDHKVKSTHRHSSAAEERAVCLKFVQNVN